METYNSFNELVAGQAQSDGCKQSQSVWNAPHLYFADQKLPNGQPVPVDQRAGIDLYIEFYARDGVVKDKDIQKAIDKAIRYDDKLFYGKMPQGYFAGFQGDTLYSTTDRQVKIGSENDVSDLANRVRLPDDGQKKWYEVAKIVK